MQFEFDPVKSDTNKSKHGINFEEAIQLWDDPMLLEVPARTTDEPHFIAIGLIGERHWSAIYTYRGPANRLISVRRARKEEVAYYESA